MIRHYLKIFFLSIIFFVVTLSVSSLGYIVLVDKNVVIGTVANVEEKQNEVVSTFDYNTDFGRIIKNSNRINVLVVGTENSRTDTILVASYDKETKNADLISVPRDTYYPREGYDRTDSKKINAIYSGEGIEGLQAAVQDILGIPINKYVVFNYEAVVECVNIMGGVEVNVPFHMVYNDPYDDPPLVIDIPAGQQLLNGDESLKFLRYRKGYANQDLGRINAQQEFIKSASKKVLSLKLPALIEEAFSHVETNFSLGELLGLAGNSIGFSAENIKSNLMPGIETPLEGLSFYIPNDDEIMNLVYTIYDLAQTENTEKLSNNN